MPTWAATGGITGSSGAGLVTTGAVRQQFVGRLVDRDQPGLLLAPAVQVRRARAPAADGITPGEQAAGRFCRPSRSDAEPHRVLKRLFPNAGENLEEAQPLRRRSPCLRTARRARRVAARKGFAALLLRGGDSGSGHVDDHLADVLATEQARDRAG